MKIIHLVLGKANPDRMNGVNKAVHKLAETQVLQGHEVTLVGLSNSRSEITSRLYSVVIFKREVYKLDPRLRDFIDNLDAQTIWHFHGGFIFDFFLIFKKLKLRNIKYLFTPHGCYNTFALRKNKTIKNLYIELFDKKIIRNAIKVIALGSSEFGAMKKRFGRSNIFLIPNGQEIPDIDFKTVGKNNDQLIFGFIGRIDSFTKGLDILLKGFYQYTLNGGGGNLWIVGDGKDQGWLEEAIINKKLDNRVIMFGPLYGNDKLQVLLKMNLFIHTSRYEGCPTSVLEAAAFGVPLLVSKETNMSDYVKASGAGMVLEQNCPEVLCGKLLEFEKFSVSTQALQDMSRNAVGMIRKNFDWFDVSSVLLDGIA